MQVDLVGAEERAAASDNANTGSAGASPAASAASQGTVRADALSADGASAVPVKRPAYASGEINLSIPPLSRKLSVTATPRDKTLEPGGNTLINVEAKDSSGTAVKDSEIAVVVVDESVLALTNYKLDDPNSIFYAERDEDTNDFHTRENVKLMAEEEHIPSNYGIDARRAIIAYEEAQEAQKGKSQIPISFCASCAFLWLISFSIWVIA